MNSTTPSSVFLGIAQVIKSLGHDPSLVAGRVGLEPAALYKDGLNVDSLTYLNFLEEAARVCNDRFLSLKIAKIQGWDNLGPIWLLIRSATTVREALETIVDNLELHSKLSFAQLIKDKDCLVLSLDVRKQTQEGESVNQREVQAIEIGLGLSCYELRAVLGENWRPEYVQFRHAAPYNLEPLKKVFGDHLSFDQDRNAIYLRNEDCERRMGSARPASRKILRREVRSQLGDFDSCSLKADRIIRLLLDEGNCRIAKLAEILGVSVRTLQLRLNKEGRSYQQLYDQARLDIATQYLESSTLSVAAIAERLNFTETAALSRFFKRHMGVCPREIIRERRVKTVF